MIVGPRLPVNNRTPLIRLASTDLTFKSDLPARPRFSPDVHNDLHQAGVSHSYDFGPPLKLSRERRNKVGVDF